MKRIILLLAVLFCLPSVALAATAEDRQLVLMTNTNFCQNGTVSTFAIDSSTDAIEQIYYVPETVSNFDKLCFSYSARAAANAPPTYKIGVEGVSTSTGRGNTTYKTGTGECSATFTPPNTTAWDGTIQCVTMTGTTCSVTQGDKIAITIRYSSGTVSATQAGVFNTHFNNCQYGFAQNNYLFTVNSGTGTKSSGFTEFTTFWGKSSASRYWGNPAVNYFQNSYNGTTEKGMQFQLPGPSSQTFQLSGVWVGMDPPTAGDTIVVTLYNGTTSLTSTTIDTDQTGSVNNGLFFVPFALQTLTFNTTYNIGVVNTTNSHFIITTDVGTGNNAYLDAWPLGINTYGITRASGGATAWTTLPAQRPMIWLVLDNIISAGASGGLINHSNVAGGSQ